MKILIFTFTVLMSQLASAEEFNFVFRFPYGSSKPVETWSTKVQAKDWETAYESASSKCASHFAAKIRRLGESTLDIIDTCANPRDK